MVSACYVGRDSVAGVMIRFMSDEIGGPMHRLLGFDLSRLNAPATAVSHCAVVSRPFHTVRTDNGLYLGMPISDLLAIMGRPTRASKNRYSFDRDQPIGADGRRLPPGSAEEYGILSTLDVHTVHERVTRISVWYSAQT
jgi:hypothetical protein